MSLFISILVIYGFGLPHWLYAVALMIWLVRLWYFYKVILGDLVTEAIEPIKEIRQIIGIVRYQVREVLPKKIDHGHCKWENPEEIQNVKYAIKRFDSLLDGERSQNNPALDPRTGRKTEKDLDMLLGHTKDILMILRRHLEPR